MRNSLLVPTQFLQPTHDFMGNLSDPSHRQPRIDHAKEKHPSPIFLVPRKWKGCRHLKEF